MLEKDCDNDDDDDSLNRIKALEPGAEITLKNKQNKVVCEKTRRLAKYGTTKPRPRLKPRVLKKNKRTRGRETPGQ